MIIDVILACSLNFCEFDCLFEKVAYEVNMDYKLLMRKRFLNAYNMF